MSEKDEWFDITMLNSGNRSQIRLDQRPMKGDIIIQSLADTEYNYIEVVACVHSVGSILTLMCKPFSFEKLNNQQQ